MDDLEGKWLTGAKAEKDYLFMRNNNNIITRYDKHNGFNEKNIYHTFSKMYTRSIQIFKIVEYSKKITYGFSLKCGE